MLLSGFDIDAMAPEALLFQTGYLTIDRTQALPGRLSFTLDCPNQEVWASLNGSLLPLMGRPLGAGAAGDEAVAGLLQAGGTAGLRGLFHAFFLDPNDWYRRSPIAQFEGSWASVFCSHFAALGLDICVEHSTHKGRVIDMAVAACGAVSLCSSRS